MLEKILSPSDCAECKLCCGFLESEIWEVPGDNSGKPIYDISFNEEGLYVCPALGGNGCTLGENKPFDCKIWPFRVMKIAQNERVAVTLSSLCKKMNEEPLPELVKFIEDELEEKIKAQVEKYPALIKDYVDDYIIIKFLN